MKRARCASTLESQHRNTNRIAATDKERTKNEQGTGKPRTKQIEAACGAVCVLVAHCTMQATPAHHSANNTASKCERSESEVRERSEERNKCDAHKRGAQCSTQPPRTLHAEASTAPSRSPFRSWAGRGASVAGLVIPVWLHKYRGCFCMFARSIFGCVFPTLTYPQNAPREPFIYLSVYI